jgi:hypothetical protein
MMEDCLCVYTGWEMIPNECANAAYFLVCTVMVLPFRDASN